MFDNDTIAAIATPMMSGGIGIIRISGEKSFQIADQIFEKINSGKKISEYPSHTIHFGYIKKDYEIIDEVLVSIMKGPSSYTKEDIIEINCHGGVQVVKCILNYILQQGARLAEPGEFTRRAFLNGRIDLSRAEAVIDVINAKNNLALKNSIGQLEGKLFDKIAALRETIIYQIAFIESALDDPEHIDLNSYPQELKQVVHKCIEKVNGLLKSFYNGRIIKEGIQTVIIGKPNAGKSSLLNVLSGRERAIVTDIAGTTRDTLEETIELGDLVLNIIDTAGIRSTDDKIEKIGVDKAIEYAEDADLILYVIDGTVELDSNDKEIIRIIKDKKGIVLLNKSDLHLMISEAEIEKRVGKPVIMISAKESQGIDQLEQMVNKMFMEGSIDFNDQICITNIRHQKILDQVSKSLEQVITSIENGMPEDFYSIDLMDAYENLGYIIGESVEEDLVNEIFSKFCTGK